MEIDPKGVTCTPRYISIENAHHGPQKARHKAVEEWTDHAHRVPHRSHTTGAGEAPSKGTRCKGNRGPSPGVEASTSRANGVLR
ncbi:hypothetical protein V6N13_037361 [Hibiscus sabdariffa]